MVLWRSQLPLGSAVLLLWKIPCSSTYSAPSCRRSWMSWLPRITVLFSPVNPTTSSWEFARREQLRSKKQIRRKFFMDWGIFEMIIICQAPEHFIINGVRLQFYIFGSRACSSSNSTKKLNLLFFIFPFSFPIWKT